GVRGGEVVGVGGGAVAEHLAEHGGAAGGGAGRRLQHQDAGALADDEAVAVPVEGHRAAAFGEGSGGTEGGPDQFGGGRLGAADHHGVGGAGGEQQQAGADGLGAAAARGGDAERLALEAVPQGELGGGGVGHHGGHRQRRDELRALLPEHLAL